MKHPPRSIKAYADSALKQIHPVLDGLYSRDCTFIASPGAAVEGAIAVWH
jgi:hypothetical protein